ncbi:putative fatty acyl-CoA reductase CG8306 isoform X1 [Aphidius gifuensis]|uniref:putative fatty acyl-CoA reductase CG8306 isoform X1 n=1 Tax=Aphidius gifuensis TaxID=684658 RepID=UPI001CDC9C4B|nr:putative fatty acyl-CoA reductase CG8306 isoform X1 [Aphidius gifuensis]
MASRVVEFYHNKNVFITGGTGFLGSCLIDKLLRCTNVNNIYLLIRPKKGKNINERLEELTKNSVFEKLREDGKSDCFNKLIAISGDVGDENLGLSSEDRLTLVEHVNIIFHSAATLDFEGTLKAAIETNLLGTRRVVQLSQEIRNLKSLVHVSSAYVNSFLLETKEQIYPAPADVVELLKLSNELDTNALEAKSPELLKDHPNSYTFTKHLAEHEVVNGKVPAGIVRPSMITGAWHEPVPGWTTSKNGPQGFLLGASKGVVRRLPVAANIINDYIPVDIVVNALIVAGYVVGRDESAGIKVYHCTSSTCNPFKWTQIENKINSYLHKYPLCGAVWYPHLKLLPSIWLYRISSIFVHLIPAYILDTVTKVAGGRPILVRMHTNINNSLGRLERFIFTEWKFNNPKMLELHESLSAEDKNIFGLDIRSLCWEDYFVELTKGVRVYLSKEPLKTLKKARSKDNMLMFANLGLQAAVLGLIWWIFKLILGASWTSTGMIVPIVYLLFTMI